MLKESQYFSLGFTNPRVIHETLLRILIDTRRTFEKRKTRINELEFSEQNLNFRGHIKANKGHEAKHSRSAQSRIPSLRWNDCLNNIRVHRFVQQLFSPTSNT